jgi:hypothetical protein
MEVYIFKCCSSWLRKQQVTLTGPCSRSQEVTVRDSSVTVFAPLRRIQTLAQPKIIYLNVASAVESNIFLFDISIDKSKMLCIVFAEYVRNRMDPCNKVETKQEITKQGEARKQGIIH